MSSNSKVAEVERTAEIIQKELTEATEELRALQDELREIVGNPHAWLRLDYSWRGGHELEILEETGNRLTVKLFPESEDYPEEFSIRKSSVTFEKPDMPEQLELPGTAE